MFNRILSMLYSISSITADSVVILLLANTVSIKIKYRKKENTLTISLTNEERFNEEANAYGFSYAFIVKE